MQTQIYDFEQLLNDFPEMSDDEIMDEYATLHRQWEYYYEREMWAEYEQIDPAHDYLAHYLAQMICSACGYKIECD